MTVIAYTLRRWRGLSTDAKPSTGIIEGEEFYETDKNAHWEYRDGAWVIAKHFYMIFRHEVAGGLTDLDIFKMAAGVLEDDFKIDRLSVTLETAPGGGKTVTVDLTDGTTTMTVAITEGNTDGSTTTNAFVFDVSEKMLEVHLSSTGSSGAGDCYVVLTCHERVA